MATGSPEDVASPESEFGGSAARLGDGHRDRAAAYTEVKTEQPAICLGRG
jgi:hypothetical protein